MVFKRGMGGREASVERGIRLTRKQLETCYQLRKELALTVRRIETCGEDSPQTQRLKEKADVLSAEIEAVENYIDSLDNSLMRQIATLRFVEGMTLKDTAAYVGYSVMQTKRYIHKLLQALTGS